MNSEQGNNGFPHFRKLMWGLGFAVILYFIMGLWGNWGKIISTFRTYPLKFFVAALGLAFSNFIIRFIRWHILLLKSDIQLKPVLSFQILMSGLAWTITPGKLGEALKSFLLKREGYPVSLSLPVIFTERLTDLFAVIILASTGFIFFKEGLTVLILSSIFTFSVLFMSISKTGHKIIISIIKKLPLISSKSEPVEKTLKNTSKLLSFKILSISIILGILGWGCEIAAFKFIAEGAGININLSSASFFYTISTLAGIVFPGGLGGMEGMLAYLLSSISPAAAITVSIIFLIRLATLWWATLLGILFWIKLSGHYSGN